MKRSQMFIKTSKIAPADEVALNAKLLIRAGFISKEMAGVYAYLPLGKRVLDNIVQIIREEMNRLGGEELSLTTLQNPETWQKSGRWDDKVVDIWFKTSLKNGSELGLAPTHEEPLTSLMVPFISSYKDLPAYPYQFQNKLRNELRAKSGLMRGREFLMKDLYSFSRDQAQHQIFYDKVADSYSRIFERLGIGEITYKTLASGGSFSQFSHEFQTISPIGEDTVYVSKSQRIAINKEIMSDEILASLGLKRGELVEEKAVEVGNIFTLGAKYSQSIGLYYTDQNGQRLPVFMGSYGMGPSRLMGFLAEHFADQRGLVWPANIAPAQVYLVNIGDDEAVVKITTEVYETLQQRGVDVIWDDRPVRPGEKFADADLIGLPYRVVVSPKSLEQGTVELKSRTSETVQDISQAQLLEKLTK